MYTNTAVTGSLSSQKVIGRYSTVVFSECHIVVEAGRATNNNISVIFPQIFLLYLHNIKGRGEKSRRIRFIWKYSKPQNAQNWSSVFCCYFVIRKQIVFTVQLTIEPTKHEKCAG